MKEYSVFQVPFLSFYSKELYRDVGKNWTGPGFGYLILILAVCWLFSMSKIGTGLNKFFNEDVPRFTEQFPEIEIVKGEVSIQESQPYYIKDPVTKKITVIIDTTGSITSLDGTEAKLLLMKSELLYKKDALQTQSHDLSTVEDLTLTQEVIHSWLKIIKTLLLPIIYVSALLLSYLLRILQALIYALLGMGFASMLKVKLSYETLIRLAVIAVTPMLIIKTVIGMVDLEIPWDGLWYFIGAMGYLFFGIKAVAETNKKKTLKTVARS